MSPIVWRGERQTMQRAEEIHGALSRSHRNRRELPCGAGTGELISFLLVRAPLAFNQPHVPVYRRGLKCLGRIRRLGRFAGIFCMPARKPYPNDVADDERAFAAPYLLAAPFPCCCQPERDEAPAFGEVPEAVGPLNPLLPPRLVAAGRYSRRRCSFCGRGRSCRNNSEIM